MEKIQEETRSEFTKKQFQSIIRLELEKENILGRVSLGNGDSPLQSGNKPLQLSIKV